MRNSSLIIAVVFLFASACPVFAARIKDYERIDGKADAPLPGKVIYPGMIADDALWKKISGRSNYHGLLTIKRENGEIAVNGTKSDKSKDTGWNVSTKPLPLTEKGLGYAFAYEIETAKKLKNSGGGKSYSSAVIWYDYAGKVIMRDAFALRSVKAGRHRVVKFGVIPAAAESFSIQFGYDWPNIVGDEYVKISSLAFSVMKHETHKDWKCSPEPEAPRIRIVSETPFADRMSELKISVTSLRPLDWTKLKISVNGRDVTAKFAREGSVLTYHPEKPWRDGIHKAKVTLVDPDDGTLITADKVFFCGQVDASPDPVTLRDDGIALVAGKPFFPIGLYGLRAMPKNGESLERAVSDTAAGGFNFVHSYQAGSTKRFLDLAHAHGLKTWTGVTIPGTNFTETLRKHPAVLAWYVGDDTASHYTPQRIYDRVDGVAAIDPRRITCQADVLGGGYAVSRYAPFVNVTDVLMPEIYPVNDVTPVPFEKCVAITVRDMKRFKADVAEYGDGRPRAVWPIIQYFKGWSSWKRYPTRDELFAMSFAAIAQGAHGITWYTYGGVYNPVKKQDNHGAASSPETWCNMTNLVWRLREIAPVLTARTPPQPPPAKVLSGPATDALEQESISMLMKRYSGATYLIAVNGTAKEVTAEFNLGTCGRQAQALWENRTLPVTGGKIVDSFAPLAVHVYKVE